jgi:hypothetical protein
MVARATLGCVVVDRGKEWPSLPVCRFDYPIWLDGREISILITTPNGGSLGSCVDEERSQMRELM